MLRTARAHGRKCQSSCEWLDNIRRQLPQLSPEVRAAMILFLESRKCQTLNDEELCLAKAKWQESKLSSLAKFT